MLWKWFFCLSFFVCSKLSGVSIYTIHGEAQARLALRGAALPRLSLAVEGDEVKVFAHAVGRIVRCRRVGDTELETL